MNLFNDYSGAGQRAGRAARRPPPRVRRLERSRGQHGGAGQGRGRARAGRSRRTERTPAKSLSYGEQRALEIGVALAAEPRLLFLDEPTAGLGSEGTARLSGLIAELKKTLTIVVIEHDMKFLFALADRISVIHWGQVIAEGAPAELMQNPWVRRSGLGGAA
jgi:branched-chain amino acid transport system ATP-binding protein